MLLIDDNPSNIKLLKTILSMAGYSNIHALSDSYQASNLYKNLNPDVVLLDLKMPGLDGFQLLEMFKEIDPDGFVPVMMLTSEESKATKLKALHAGVKDFLTKPFDRLEVLFRINNLIETHNLYKSLQERNRSLDDIVRERTNELKKEITVRREAEEHIRHQALHDSLTGLPNRSLLRDRLQQDIYTASRNNKHVSVLLIDIDRFSEINNTLGHRNGDILLMQVAHRLNSTLRHGDTVARYERQIGPETVARSGGNSFTVTLPMLPTIETVDEIVSRIREIFTLPFDLDGFSLEVSARISIVHYPEHGENSELLLHRSDVAMYHAKKMNQDCVVYSPELDNFSTFRLTLMSELRQAISNNGLNMHYQPKIDMTTGKIIGFEALVRWVHDEHGFIPPDHFVPMAEETGMIRLLSQWVLHTTINHCQTFSKDGMPGNISVNLSAQDLLDPNLVDAIENILKETGLDPELLTLEVTESAMMEDPRNALQVITRISDLGVKFSIDDFGTGYSSLSYLKKLPVAEIKIDKSFVIDMRNNPDDTVIVRSTIDLAHNLGRYVVAEGIEDQKTLQILRDLGCDYAQGYYLSEPLPRDSLQQWYESTGNKRWI
ncbi:MAG: EAL domain-containing protein [Thiohalophilus sp.]